MSDFNFPTSLGDSAQIGMGRLPNTQLAALRQHAQNNDFSLCELDLAMICEKPDILTFFERAFQFPPSFGHNWDALEDYLCDLSWIHKPGIIIVLHHFARVPKNCQDVVEVLIDILTEACRTHAQHHYPFWCLQLEELSAGRNDTTDLP